MKTYVLDENKMPVLTEDRDQINNYFADMSKRRVALTEVGKDIVISTVFLVLDHNFSDEGDPLLFETLVMGNDVEEMERYSSWDEALQGHNRWVNKLSQGELVALGDM